MIRSDELQDWKDLPLWQHESDIDSAGQVFPMAASGGLSETGFLARRHANNDVFALVEGDWVQVAEGDGQFFPSEPVST